MSVAEVEIFDPRYPGHYPSESIIIGNEMGYFVHKQIPFYFEIHSNIHGKDQLFSSFLPMRELLQASLLFSTKHFPIFVFSPISHADIHINSDDEITPKDLIVKVKNIVDGNEKIPLLYDPYKTHEFSEARSIIEEIRVEKEYIDLFHSRQIPFADFISLLSRSFDFSEFEANAISVESYYRLFLGCSRGIHIALYYIINAARLLSSFFTEDAGINLNLASEAIIKDYLKVSGIQNKKRAIRQLLSEDLKFDEEKVDWYLELYEARNEFLAHIDEDMFTESQNISDPDAYCYDHWEDIVNLVISYIGLGKS
jgi:hypothetical protein